MDLAIAAAAVGNQTDAELIAALASASGAGGNDESMYADPIDLPCVSDLEVAAAAAAAALEVLAPGSSSEEEGSSDDDDSSDSDEDSSSAGDSMSTDQDGDVHMADAARAVRHVALELVPGPQGLTATLRVLQQHTGTGGPARAAGTVPAAAQGREVETDSSDGSSSSSSSSSEESDVESVDMDEMRDLITKAYEEADEDDDKGDGARGAASIREALGLPELQPLDVEVGPDEVLQPAGTILSVLEGMVVVQGPAHSRALKEGSVLVLEDRAALGRVEEVFGPVMMPLYALRYAGRGPPPPGMKAGSLVFSVPRLAEFILPEEVYSQRAADQEEEGGEEEEPEFSDDEKEAAYQWKLKAKRKADEPEQGGPAPGAAGKARRQRQQGGGRGGGSGNGASATFQAHATAGQMDAMLALGAGRGGRGGAGGRRGGSSSGAGAGRGGRGGRGGSGEYSPRGAQAGPPAAPEQRGGIMSAQYGAPGSAPGPAPQGAFPPPGPYPPSTSQQYSPRGAPPPGPGYPP
eukprot:CAMPEP_0202892194 /NCGR_PEP_ID=MMETSP1392-20130828/1980_1 /ASSEMBLY_ACC=CAM_ASM_000868 /TAXON_ID=225041 /ORGANISM="Chlamydomonas chlamydogama, Strain SAG 11-48b" /LENGTH=519 /DNA_ID=CAMNT_0049576083 /DNA_START=101 /DNA_END=1656 /DNA_ORIENTATION=-